MDPHTHTGNILNGWNALTDTVCATVIKFQLLSVVVEELRMNASKPCVGHWDWEYI